MRKAYSSTEQIHNWWNLMQSRQATSVYAVKDRGIYRLRAFTENKKKCGEISLGLKDKRFAQRIAISLAVSIDENTPVAVINKYIDHLEMHRNACQSGKHILSSLAQSAKHNIQTIKSRLYAHLLPFCQKKHITDILDMFRREVIRAYLDYLKETQAISDTARSIMATTLTFLRWFDGKQEVCRMDTKFYTEIRGWRGYFGNSRKRPKLFLTSEHIQTILHYDYTDDRIKAMFLIPLVCGVRYNELINLKWRDLNQDKGNMNVMVAKGGTHRTSQLPCFIQDFLKEVRNSRRSGTLPGDYLFTGYDRSRDLTIYKTILKEITGESSSDMASNCLRRSGCNLIEKYRHGLGDLQLGHSICTKITYRSYIDSNDYQEVNDFWDAFYSGKLSPAPIMGKGSLNTEAKPSNLIDFTHINTEVG